jgi:hypothetical protein
MFGVDVFGGFLPEPLAFAAMLELPGKLSVQARRLSSGQAGK